MKLGTNARLALQGLHPVSGVKGTFLFFGESHRLPEAAVSPALDGIAEMHQWAIANGWKSVREGYQKIN